MIIPKHRMLIFSFRLKQQFVRKFASIVDDFPSCGRPFSVVLQNLPIKCRAVQNPDFTKPRLWYYTYALRGKCGRLYIGVRVSKNRPKGDPRQNDCKYMGSSSDKTFEADDKEILTF